MHFFFINVQVYIRKSRFYMDKNVCRAFMYIISFHGAKKRDVLSKLLIASHIIFYFDGIRRFILFFFFLHNKAVYPVIWGGGQHIAQT